MAGDVIGSAVIEVTADASGLSAGIAQATQAVKGFEAAAAGSGARAGAAMSKANKDASITSAQLTREQERLITSINNYSTTVGKSRGEILEYRAAQAGVTDQVQAQIAAIRAQESALRSGGKEFNKYGISAAQTSAALRGVPAQITDIVTSLQGGQAPLTVFLQQGGQLKDMFGGVVPAAKALGSAVLGLVNPYTLAAAAAVAIGAAYAYGSKEADGYVKALALTGNAAGTTASQLAYTAQQISGLVGTQHEAAEALAALAGTGRVAGSDLQRFGEVAVRAQKAIGTSVQDTAKDFAALGREPVKESQRLNETMNYLTLATYEQIKAAKANGDEARAAGLAQNAYADAVSRSTAGITSNLGLIQRAWRDLATDAQKAINLIANVGRPATLNEGLADAQKRLAFVQQNGGNQGPIRAEIDGFSRRMLREQEQAADQAETARSNKEKTAASDRLDAQVKASRTRAQQRSDEIEQFKKDAKLTGLVGQAYADGLAGINERFKDKKVASPKAYQDDGATKYLQQLRETGATLEAQLATEQKIGNEAKKLLEFEQLIVDLKVKGSLTADQKSYIAQQDLMRGQLQHNALNERLVELKDAQAKKDKEALDALDKFKERAAQINEQMERANATRSAGFDASLGTYGMGDRARGQAADRMSVRREYDGYRTQTDRKLSTGVLNSDEYTAAVAKIQENLNEAYAAVEDYYRRDAAARGNWVNGASRALQNYADEASDVAKHTEEVFSNAFKGLEDQFTNLLSGDKFDVKKLLKDTQGDLTRNFVKEDILGPLAKAGNELFGAGIFGSAGGAARGSSVANPLYVRSADPVSGLASSIAGGSSGGGWLDSLVGIGASMFGGFGNGAATAMANVSGTGLDGLFRYTDNFAGRANGGWVGARGFAEVAENAPELITVGNKTMLATGNQSAQVTPLGQGGGTVIQHFNVGDVASVSMVREAVKQSQNQARGALMRSRSYGGELA